MPRARRRATRRRRGGRARRRTGEPRAVAARLGADLHVRTARHRDDRVLVGGLAGDLTAASTLHRGRHRPRGGRRRDRDLRRPSGRLACGRAGSLRSGGGPARRADVPSDHAAGRGGLCGDAPAHARDGGLAAAGAQPLPRRSAGPGVVLGRRRRPVRGAGTDRGAGWGRAGGDPRLHRRAAGHVLRGPARLAVPGDRAAGDTTARCQRGRDRRWVAGLPRPPPGGASDAGLDRRRGRLGRRRGPDHRDAVRRLARLAARGGHRGRPGGAAVRRPAGIGPRGSLDEGRAGGVDRLRRAERHRHRRDHARRSRTAMAVRRAHRRPEARTNARTASTRRCSSVGGPSPSFWKMLRTCFSTAASVT